MGGPSGPEALGGPVAAPREGWATSQCLRPGKQGGKDPAGTGGRKVQPNRTMDPLGVEVSKPEGQGGKRFSLLCLEKKKKKKFP